MEGQTSIAARIAALKLNQVNAQGPGWVSSGTRRPISRQSEDAERPVLSERAKSINTPQLGTYGSVTSTVIGNQPASIKHSDAAKAKGPPSLPPRVSSGLAQGLERGSLPGMIGARETNTSLARGVSPTTDESELYIKHDADSDLPRASPSLISRPQLPARPKSVIAATPRKAVNDHRPAIATTSSPAERYPQDKRALPVVPPRRSEQAPRKTGESRPGQGETKPRRSALSLGFDGTRSSAIAESPLQPDFPDRTEGKPPPVPRSSRPDLAALKASKPRSSISLYTTEASDAEPCLLCRDFSHVDAHAAKFPRQSVPGGDLVWLASQLTAPFPSHTDKAQAFYSGRHKPDTPSSTFSEGLAVCAGYAGLYNTLALKAGLESMVIVGHGKGVGYTETAVGAPLPAYNGNHAWNAVRIDNGQWKLLDSCWGAGYITAMNMPYTRKFSPHHFTHSNIDLGASHFPSDPAMQMREDGQTLSWEGYLLLDMGAGNPTSYSGYLEEEGISKKSFKPEAAKISHASLVGPTTRFQFSSICEHWDPLRNGRGKYYCYVLEYTGAHGSSDEVVRTPFKQSGMFWWVDVPMQDLRGAIGKQVKIAAITSIDGKDARGVEAVTFQRKNGRTSMGWSYVVIWDMVA